MMSRTGQSSAVDKSLGKERLKHLIAATRYEHLTLAMELKRHSHEERLSIAQQIGKAVVDKYGPRVLAVYVSGSTAKKLDRPYSDLEMIVIVDDKTEIPPTHYVYDGMVVGVDYSQETDFLKQAGRIGRNWPMEADQFRNRIVLHDPKHFTARLDAAVARADVSDDSEALRNLTISLFEGLEVMNNVGLNWDEEVVRTAGFWFAQDATSLVLLLNKKYVLTSTWFWRIARECPLKPEGFWKRVERITGFVPCSPREIMEFADSLARDLLEMVETRGISIQSRRVIA